MSGRPSHWAVDDRENYMSALGWAHTTRGYKHLGGYALCMLIDMGVRSNGMITLRLALENVKFEIPCVQFDLMRALSIKTFISCTHCSFV